MAKQTGLSGRVKAVLGRVMGGVIVIAVAGCASSWHNPRKSAAEASVDEKACARQAEDNVLARAGRQREDYRMGATAPRMGMNRGESPMELVERRATQDNYGRDFENCMTAKGYERG